MLVAGFLAAPAGLRSPEDSPYSAHLVRAEEGADSNAPVEIKPETGTVCSGSPDYAKGITDSAPVVDIPAAKPVFEKDRKTAVLSLINYPWQELGYNIVFMGPRVGYRAMTLTARHRIEIYVRPGEGLLNQAFDLAHELGHAFDLKYNNEERRRKWCELRGINPSTPWFGCDACPDYNTPAGDFAETFAYLLLGPGNYHSLIAPPPKPEQLLELASFCNIDNMSKVLLVRLPKKPGSAPVKSAKAAAKPEAPAAEAAPAVVESAKAQVSAAEENPSAIQNAEEKLELEGQALSPETPDSELLNHQDEKPAENEQRDQIPVI